MIRRAFPIVVGIGVVVAMVWAARPAGSGLEWRLAFVGAYGLGFVLLIAYLRRAQVSTRRLLLGAVLFRLAALPMLPSLSDDGYRYIWDGVIAAEASVSPYALRPNDPALRAWQDERVYARMNSPGYYSVYPPASQSVFRVAASVYRELGWTGSWWLLKTLLVIVELGGVILLARVVGAHGAALYAWSPLAVVEVAGQGHTEALVVGGIGLVIATAGSRFPLRSIGATVAGLAKLYPLALLPATWRREGWAGVAASVLLGGALSALVWTPGAAANAGESLELFFGTFDVYAGPYRLLKAVAYPVLGEEAGQAASVTLTVGYGAAVARAFSVDDGTPRGLHRVVLVVVVGFGLVTATFHPWYGLPLLFLIPLLDSPNWLLWLAALCTTTYLGYEWHAFFDVATLIGWGGAALLLFRHSRNRHASHHGQGATPPSRSSRSVEAAGSQSASS
ncbi:hypothetical protein [Rubrivirga marina]|uniref:DUF2029 domain-containing protein n=1 Tax=Rubrivirga marina TaxID=1196024 RepID=A0A271J2Q9_9BACT|nr:hypothetical protein [Rubrivirga marina]PAP77334.1 hypothetical protein BSZ37_13265 [Rubrivirga marina]